MPNIAIIVLDSLRFDTFSKYFDWLDGLRFTNAWSTSNWTVPAHASLLTGRYPTETNTTVKSRSLSCESDLITEQLQNEGYTSRIVTTNFQIFEWDGWERGFDERFGPDFAEIYVPPAEVVNWVELDRETDSTGLVKYVRAAVRCAFPDYKTIPSLREGYRFKTGHFSSLKAVKTRLKTLNFTNDEFLLMNIMDMHVPYYPPNPYRSFDRKIKPELEEGLADCIEDKNAIKQAYDDCARYLSDAYQSLHKDLLVDFDYVITLSDHGEHLGEEQLWSHSYGIHPELTHVPIVISGDGVEDAEIESPVSLVDVHRTIADIADIDVESHGQSLLSDIEQTTRLVEYHGLSDQRREKFAEKGIASEFDRYDESLDGVISPKGYAFETPDEGLQVQGDWTQEEASCRLKELRTSIDRQPIQSNQTDIPERIQERLKALGYA